MLRVYSLLLYKSVVYIWIGARDLPQSESLMF